MTNQAERYREAMHRIEVLEATVEWRVEQLKKLMEEKNALEAALRKITVAPCTDCSDIARAALEGK